MCGCEVTKAALRKWTKVVDGLAANPLSEDNGNVRGASLRFLHE